MSDINFLKKRDMIIAESVLSLFDFPRCCLYRNYFLNMNESTTARRSHRRCSMKKCVFRNLGISQNSQKTSVPEPLF